jgi:hypothetical protein
VVIPPHCGIFATRGGPAGTFNIFIYPQDHMGSNLDPQRIDKYSIPNKIFAPKKGLIIINKRKLTIGVDIPKKICYNIVILEWFLRNLKPPK